MPKKMSVKEIVCATLLGLSISVLSGCLAVVGGAGAEIGYVASQEGRTTAELLEDQRITSTIKTKLLADETTPGMDINVDTFKRKVTLTGVLKSRSETDHAINIADSVEGVINVKSKLYLQ